MKLIQFVSLSIFLWFHGGIVEGIVGGKEASKDEFKYQASLLANKVHVCGASILNDFYVITAAHCVINKDNKFTNTKYTVVAGTVNTKTKTPSKVKIDVEKLYVPKQFVLYTPRSDTSDFAVLKLKTSLELNINSGLAALNLPDIFDSAPTYENSFANITGFGSTKCKRKPGEKRDLVKPCSSCTKLKYAEATILSNARCSQLHADHVKENLICAQVKQHGVSQPEGVCDGDFGGPLVFNGDTLIGILSNGPPTCNETNRSGTYTRITSFVPLIRDIISGVKVLNVRVAEYEHKKNKHFGLLDSVNLVESAPA